MKLKISPEHLKHLNEFLNTDLSISNDDKRDGFDEVSTSRMKGKGSRQMTGNDFQIAATQNTPLYAQRTLREDEQGQQFTNIGSIDILDALNQQGLKSDLNNLVSNLNALPEDHSKEITAVSLKFILQNVKWDQLAQEIKDELKTIIQ